MRVAAFRSGLSPASFWRATPHEVSLAVQAHGLQLEWFHSLAAWHLAPLLSVWGKRKVSPDQLLGKRSGDDPNRMPAMADPAEWAFEKWASDPNIK